MVTALPVARVGASNSAATFGRDILEIAQVENCGKKLPGYSFARMARHLWPQKTPASIEFYTGAPERTGRHIVQKDSDPGSALLAKVIDSDQGWRALQWIMRDSGQKWWADLLEAQRRAKIFDGAIREVQGELPLSK